MNVISLDNISFSPFFALTFTDFYLEVHINGSGCKQGIAHTNGYVSVRTDREYLVMELRNKIGKFDTFFGKNKKALHICVTTVK